MPIATSEIKPDVDVGHSHDDDRGIWSKLGALRGSRDPLRLLLQLARLHDGCIPIRTCSQRVLLLSKPEHFKHVLVSRSDRYSKYMEGLKPLFGNSMITLDGALWQRLRAVEQPAFGPDMIAGYVPFFVAAIDGRMRKWEEASEGGKTIDICEESWALAAEMTCRALFDRDQPFNARLVYSAVRAFIDVPNQDAVGVRAASGAPSDIDGNEVSSAAETWMALPRLLLGADPREGRERTLLRMLEAAAADPAMAEFDQQEVLDEIKQYLWAGTETTALTLAWALYQVARQPEIAQRIRSESFEVYGNRAPTAADHPKLVYTRKVLLETMRMYPPIWSLARKADAKDVIGGHQVEAGDIVVLCTYAAHHDSRHWEDPERFIPERFDADRARPAYCYLPFGGGKRACIGSAMSQVENVLALSLLLDRFEFDYLGRDPVEINPTVTLSPKGGLPFRIRRRRPVRDFHLLHRLAAVPADACPYQQDAALSRLQVQGASP